MNDPRLQGEGFKGDGASCGLKSFARTGYCNGAADSAQTLVQVVSHASRQAGVQAAAISAQLTGNQSPPKQATEETEP